MEDPTAFLVAVWIEELHIVVFYRGIDDGGESSFFKSNDFFPVCAKTGFKRVDAVFILQIAKGHIGGKAFAKPEVFPLRFGSGIAEPLVGYLVCHQRFDARGTHAVFVIEDSTGIFETAEAGL